MSQDINTGDVGLWGLKTINFSEYFIANLHITLIPDYRPTVELEYNTYILANF